jgi:hypothetical protein
MAERLARPMATEGSCVERIRLHASGDPGIQEADRVEEALLLGRSRRHGLEQAAELLHRVVVQQASVADSRHS